MRGSHIFSLLLPHYVGIIPAHAGLTISSSHQVLSVRDHPRACGAHMGTSLFSLAAEGSSPRMRGSRLERNQCHLVAGIIPAHAGLTFHYVYYQYTCVGSSPRMRGSRILYSCYQCILRIIPAHAGLTHGVQMIGVGVRDHPRACGAHSTKRV